MNERRAESGRAAVAALAIACVLAGIAIGVALARRAARVESTSPATSMPAASAQLWTCGMHPQVIQDHPGTCPICHMKLVPLDTRNAGPELAIDPHVVQLMGVRTAKVARGTSRRSVRAVGTIEERETDHVDVTLRVTGIVDKLLAGIDGMPVKKGEPLFELDSPELTVAVGELIGARHEAERVGESTEHALAGEILESARAKLLELGLSADAVDRLAKLDRAPRTVTFQSPMEGHVTAKAIYTGSTVRPGDRVMRIANNMRVWLDARVLQRDLGSILVGAEVRAHVDAFPSEVFTGKVLFVHPHLDMTTRTALVRVELDNTEMGLRENMWANVEIVGDTWSGVLLVPREAVIDTGRRKFAFVALGDGRFAARDVEIGPSGDTGLAPVITGLVEGEEVVTSGQFLLDAESRTRDAIHKYFDERKAVADAGTTTPRPASKPAPNAEWTRAVDPVILAYLEIASALGAAKSPSAALDARPLVAAAEALRAALANEPPAKLADEAASAARALVGAPLDEQRERFKRLSETIVDLIDAIPPSSRVGNALYLMRCPMAPGRWLQRGSEVANPFYAETMKQCGEVVRRIELAGSAPK